MEAFFCLRFSSLASKTEIMIELRSDTFTKPNQPMLESMMKAEVGDDIFQGDPTVNALQEKLADMFGMEAGIFCPSGTMTNQIAIRVHTVPQDEVICDWRSHIYQYEGGGIASNSGVSVRLLEGDRGRITADQVLESISPDDIHAPVTKLVSVESTMNRGGGSYYDLNELKKLRFLCTEHKLKFHLDGARLFNALVETEEDPKEYGAQFDTISICLSKGLGAPVGSVLLGSEADIKRARRVRKVFGGGMRQAGYLAQAGIFALDNNIDRLKDDHRRARTIGATLEGLNYVEKVFPIDTNIVIFTLTSEQVPKEFLKKLKENGILAVPFGKQDIRFVTHLDYTEEMLDKTVEILKTLN